MTPDIAQNLPPEVLAALQAEMEASGATPVAADEDDNARLESLGKTHLARLDQLKNDKRTIENRMMTSLRNYMGKYSEADKELFVKAKSSGIFINLLGRRADSIHGRTCDVFCPTDELNGDIQPTPIPEMASMTKSEKPLGQAADGTQIQEQDLAATVTEDAKVACDGMRKVFEDCLAEDQYNPKMRKAILNMFQVGTAIIEGPVVRRQCNSKWTKQTSQGPDGKEVVVRILEKEYENVPSFNVISPWDFYPYPLSAKSPAEAEGFYVRIRMTSKQLREFAKTGEGALTKNLTDLLRNPPTSDIEANTQYKSEINSIAGLNDSRMFNSYEVFKYTGPIDFVDAKAAGITDPDAEDDPMQPIYAVVYTCQGKVIKAHPPESDDYEPNYSVLQLVHDEATMFGYGLGNIAESSVAMLNGAARMMMDHAALTVGPQIVINTRKIKGSDGDNLMKGRKTWYSIPDDGAGNDDVPPFQIFPIPSELDELQKLFNLSMELLNEETQFPLILQGDSQRQVAVNTATGAAAAMAAAAAPLRRFGKRIDDEITVPNFRRLYNYQMQYNKDDSIKGDFQIIPKGAGVLAEREVMSQQIMAIINMTVNPQTAMFYDAYAAHSEWVKSMRMPTTIMKTREDVEAAQKQQQEQAAQQGQGVDPNKKAELDFKTQTAEKDYELRTAQLQGMLRRQESQDTQQSRADEIRGHIADTMAQIKISEMASTENITREAAAAEFAKIRMQMDNDNQKFNAESEMKKTIDPKEQVAGANT